MLNSERGRIVLPDLDDRTWQDLVDEARALIPKYAPQWTDHNTSDLGIALIELFAWLVEGLIYRLNRVPEKNYIAFLNMLGITRDPATPARAFLTFSAQPATVIVPRGTQAQTQGTETEAPIVFETDESVTVLPTKLKAALLINKGPTNTYINLSSAFTTAPATGTTITIPGSEAVQLCLGFDQTTAEEIRLRIKLSNPVRIDPATGTPQALIKGAYSEETTEPTAWPILPGWTSPGGLPTDDTKGLQRDGFLSLTLPATWSSQAPSSWKTISPKTSDDKVNDAYFWLGINIMNMTTAPVDVGIDHILFNAASAHNALTIPVPETLGQSNGKPFQVFPLQNRPLFKRLDTDTPYDHLEVQVGGTTWALVDELPAGAAEIYRLDPVAGEISFGNFDPRTDKGHGSFPPDGSAITATTYRYVAGGLAGNVGAGRINAMRTTVPGIIGVTNLFSSFGASDEEPIAETLRRAPEELKVRSRAVTAEDYEFLAREATTDVVIVRCLEPRMHRANNQPAWKAGDPWTFGAIDRSPGNVNVIIVPDQGLNVPRPEPTTDLLGEVQAYLDRRRDLTARLAVTGPRYLPIKVVITGAAWQRAIDQGLIGSEKDVENYIWDKLRRYLHPIHGGLDGKGWKVEQSVFIADLFKATMPPENVGFISSLTVEAEVPAYHFPPLNPNGKPDNYDENERPFRRDTAGGWVRVADYELVCYGTSSIVNISKQ